MTSWQRGECPPPTPKAELALCVFLCHAEQVSARIVQEVTAEAVAVLKGEQEPLQDPARRLPSGRAPGPQGGGVTMVTVRKLSGGLLPSVPVLDGPARCKPVHHANLGLYFVGE